jgi:hypothetical protein
MLKTLLIAPLAYCFFEQFFQQREDHQEEEKAPAKEPGCKGFVCPLDGKCVLNPIDCGCSTGQNKCLVGDWYLCLNGGEICKQWQ